MSSEQRAFKSDDAIFRDMKTLSFGLSLWNQQNADVSRTTQSGLGKERSVISILFTGMRTKKEKRISIFRKNENQSGEKNEDK